MILSKISEFFATVCYIGKIKFAPGTFGSLVAFPICYLIMHLTLKYQIIFPIANLSVNEQQFISLFFIELIASLIIFMTGTYFTSIYLKTTTEKDPSEVVIDEVVGQMLTIIFSSFSIILVYSSSLPAKFDSFYIEFLFLILLPFILFRLFDILKPWPINWLDRNIKGAFGVMVDDIAAAVFAITVNYVIVFFIIDFYKI